MYKELFNLSVKNFAASLIGFLNTYLIVNYISLDFLGDFTIFLSVIGVINIVFTIVPNNFSIFRIQDDKNFERILFNYYLLVPLFFLPLFLLIWFLLYQNISFIWFYLYIIGSGFLSYFDIICQAKGRLKFYYNILLLITISKLVIVLVVSYFKLNFNTFIFFNSIVLATSFFIIIFYLNRNFLKTLIRKPRSIFDIVKFLKLNFKILKPYYLNVILKKIRSNSIILLFTPFVSVDIIGLYSLFIKPQSFVFGLFRTMEAFFMKKENIIKFKKLFYQHIFLLSLLMFCLSFSIGICYLKITVNQFYFVENFILAILSFSYIKYIYMRSSLLSTYSNKTLNISEILFLLITVLLISINYYFNFNSIIVIIFTYFLSTQSLQLFLIYKTQK